MNFLEAIAFINIQLSKCHPSRDYRDFFIGCTNDIEESYKVHQVSSESTWCIEKDVNSEDVAKAVVDYYHVQGMNSNIENETGVWIYCYKITMQTKE